jgi:hypothetical protein
MPGWSRRRFSQCRKPPRESSSRKNLRCSVSCSATASSAGLPAARAGRGHSDQNSPGVYQIAGADISAVYSLGVPVPPPQNYCGGGFVACAALQKEVCLIPVQSPGPIFAQYSEVPPSGRSNVRLVGMSARPSAEPRPLHSRHRRRTRRQRRAPARRPAHQATQQPVGRQRLVRGPGAA